MSNRNIITNAEDLVFVMIITTICIMILSVVGTGVYKEITKSIPKNSTKCQCVQNLEWDIRKG